ncbi:MAG TPA: amidohydrolase [Streptosporangiaceae bacterium]|jgi:hypothetical protein
MPHTPTDGAADGPADLVFHGGHVFTADDADTRAQAVAVRAGRIAAVGSDADVRAHTGPHTEVVDLAGRALLPGFIDAHAHPVSGGVEMNRCDLSGAVTLADYKTIIAAYAEGHPDEAWILGGGWSMEAFEHGLPTAAPLDEVTGARPVFLPNRDHHSAWVNTAALRLAGIDRDTPDPDDGRVERDADGTPTGALHEGAMRLVDRHVPATTRAEVERGLRTAQAHLHALGVTGWQDAMVGKGQGAGTPPEVYADLDGRGELTARVVGALWWDRYRGAEQVPELRDLRTRFTGDRFRATTVKMMLDGVFETGTAAMIAPYLDRCGHATHNHGINFINPDTLPGYVTELDGAGFQVHFHALGDGAVRAALDALTAARTARNGTDADLRHHLAHIQVVHPDDLPRFADLGATANAQPLWACLEPQMTDLTVPFLGPERTAWQYPFGALHRLGTHLAFGSDWPVSSPDPLKELHVAVHRTPPGEPGTEVFLPEQRLDLPTALRAFTAGSAYVNHLDGLTGTISAGKAADLVVLDRDILAEPAALDQAKVLLTCVDGRPVHEAPGL